MGFNGFGEVLMRNGCFLKSGTPGEVSTRRFFRGKFDCCGFWVDVYQNIVILLEKIQ